MKTYDYVIVGAGSAGCVLADRLSEDGRSTVLILEAGGKARNPIYGLPMMAGHLFQQKANNWFYHTEEQPHLHHRRVFIPRGKMVGGTFIFNGMVYIRGQSQDYDGWAQLGNRGWSFAEVLPYFKKAEQHESGASELHGADGPLIVSRAVSSNPLFKAFIDAGIEAGFGYNQNFNGDSQAGFGRYDFTIKNGRRWNSASAYLQPALKRKNVEIISGAHVTKLTIKDRRVTGVEFKQGALARSVSANREVVLCAGVINTPQILLLSGIGHQDELQRLGITVHHHLPGVGKNLQDHTAAMLAFVCREPVSLVRDLRLDRFIWQLAKAMVGRRGPVSQSALGAGCFLTIGSDATSPNAQGYFMPIYPNGARLSIPFLTKIRNAETGPTFALKVGPTRPESRGYVSLGINDPFAPPLIQPLYFSDERDLVITREAVKVMRHVISQKSFDLYRGIELVPGPGVQSDDEIDSWCRGAVSTVHHAVGTSKMGHDAMSVVDDQLRVHGMAGLRIVDASIMPLLISGNTNAATIMIAEKAADMIRSRFPLTAMAGR